MKYDIPNYLSFLALVPAADIAANATGTTFDLQNYIGDIAIRADIANFTAGSSPLLNLIVQESTNNANWTVASPTFTANSNSANVQLLSYDTRAHGRYLRIITNVSGANASCPLSIVGVAQSQYNPT